MVLVSYTHVQLHVHVGYCVMCWAECTDMVYQHGILTWRTNMAYQHGIPTWHTNMAY